ncbi:MAG: hypothetical protein R3C28_33615 [Pirellulaceae bacterium]
MATVLLSTLVVCGCTRDPDGDGWIAHSLTESQEKRQDELLNEIQWLISGKDDLAGKSAADFSELLSLADKTKIDGTTKIHAYKVLSGGDLHEPCHAEIIVSDGKIVQAGWPYGEY